MQMAWTRHLCLNLASPGAADPGMPVRLCMVVLCNGSVCGVQGTRPPCALVAHHHSHTPNPQASTGNTPRASLLLQMRGSPTYGTQAECSCPAAYRPAQWRTATTSFHLPRWKSIPANTSAPSPARTPLLSISKNVSPLRTSYTWDATVSVFSGPPPLRGCPSGSQCGQSNAGHGRGVWSRLAGTWALWQSTSWAWAPTRFLRHPEVREGRQPQAVIPEHLVSGSLGPQAIGRRFQCEIFEI